MAYLNTYVCQSCPENWIASHDAADAVDNCPFCDAEIKPQRAHLIDTRVSALSKAPTADTEIGE